MAGLHSYVLSELSIDADVYVATICMGVLIRNSDSFADPERLSIYSIYIQRSRAEHIITAGNGIKALHDKDMAERGVMWERPR